MAKYVIADTVRQAFTYKDGKLFWKKCKAPWIRPGSRAGSKRKDGYWEVGFNGKNWLLHRLIYLFHKGKLPPMLDHIDRNPSNCRIENLRPSNKAHNAHNSGKNTRNTSGYKGVSWDKAKGKWCVRTKHEGKYKFLGYFTNKKEAYNVYINFWKKEGLRG